MDAGSPTEPESSLGERRWWLQLLCERILEWEDGNRAARMDAQWRSRGKRPDVRSWEPRLLCRTPKRTQKPGRTVLVV